jgi:hypothetical protein
LEAPAAPEAVLVPFTADFVDGDEDGFFAFNGMLLDRGLVAGGRMKKERGWRIVVSRCCFAFPEGKKKRRLLKKS